MRHLKDLPVLILGLGASGLAMARWCARHGAVVTVADTREAPASLATLQAELPEVSAWLAEQESRADPGPAAWPQTAWATSLRLARGLQWRLYARRAIPCPDTETASAVHEAVPPALVSACAPNAGMARRCTVRAASSTTGWSGRAPMSRC